MFELFDVSNVLLLLTTHCVRWWRSFYSLVFCSFDRNSQGLGGLGQNGGNQNSLMSGSGDPGSNPQTANGFTL